MHHYTVYFKRRHTTRTVHTCTVPVRRKVKLTCVAHVSHAKLAMNAVAPRLKRKCIIPCLWSVLYIHVPVLCHKEWLLHATLCLQTHLNIIINVKNRELFHSITVTAKSSKKNERRQVNEKLERE